MSKKYPKAREASMPWLSFLLIVLSSLLPILTCEDSITAAKSISSNQTIVSAGGRFVLGFFSPGNSTNRYIGVWYNTIPKLTVIWVANRETPLPKSSDAVFTISEDGNLVILNERKEVIWTSNVSATSLSITSAVAVLLDNGNLVLRHGENNGMWESFQHPTDTFVPEMRISSNRITGQKTHLTSWADDEDPKPGIFSIGIDPNRRQFYLWKGHEPSWRSNIYPITYSFASSFIRYDQGFSSYLTFVVQGDEVYLVAGTSINSVRLRFTVVPNGLVQLLVWQQTSWVALWQVPLRNCEFYGRCGPFAICEQNGSIPLCKCLTGFEPKSQINWVVGNWTGGCVRKKALGCYGEDRFLKFMGMKLPDYVVIMGNTSISNCEFQCLKNCSCTAYAYVNNTEESIVVCLNWFRELVDMVNNFGTGHDLYVRLHGSELVHESGGHRALHSKRLKIAVVTAIVSAGLLLISVFSYLWRKKRLRRKVGKFPRFNSEGNMSGVGQDDAELLTFSLASVLAATGSFSVENKLGEGGFGPVYKGSLPGNRDVAIKRLSTRSLQGHEEFMNELKLIAKLQHRNLVRLLGCCVEEDEKILIYEYMPNRSLDKFLFDPSQNVNLDWTKRFDIIEGIAQGLLYLHKYSRLRVIHRDLKASNILLDQAMTPKISDFGMARIVGMNQNEDKTNRVVGTYGYMAPEYAVFGRFSEKSDVFSFGVLLLEIVTGKRNTDFHHTELSVTLLEWAWKEWKEGRSSETIDRSIQDTCILHQAVKCITVGLLCVQELASERPTMSEVVVMLSNETATIPTPKEPAFAIHRFSEKSCTSSQAKSSYSNNDATMTTLEPR